MAASISSPPPASRAGRFSPVAWPPSFPSIPTPWPPQAPDHPRPPHRREWIPQGRIWAFPASPTHTHTYTSSHARASSHGVRVVHALQWLFFRVPKAFGV